MSWETVLRKRERYRKVFADFDPARVARFTKTRIERLLSDPSIIRNRAKIESTVSNAQAFLKIQRDFGSFDAYVWRFVSGKRKRSKRRSKNDVPTTSPQAEALSQDLRARGFRFVGPTICYAFMQAVGMVDDHAVDCAWRGRQRAP